MSPYLISQISGTSFGTVVLRYERNVVKVRDIADNVDFIRPAAFFLNNFIAPVLQGFSIMTRTESTVFYQEQNTE